MATTTKQRLKQADRVRLRLLPEAVARRLADDAEMRGQKLSTVLRHHLRGGRRKGRQYR